MLERFPYPLDLFGEIVDDNDRRSFDRGRTLEDREGDSCRLATTDVGDDRAVPTGLARQLCGQPSPPHARRPNEEHRTAMPVARASPRPAEPPKLVLPANERAHQIELRREFGLSSTVGRAWRDDRCCVCRGHASRTYRFADPLQLEGFRRLEGQPIDRPGQVDHALAGENLAGARSAAQASREVQRTASVPAGNGDGFTGVQTEAHTERESRIVLGRFREGFGQLRGGAERITCRREDGECLIAPQFDELASAGFDTFLRDLRESCRQPSCGLVAMLLGECRIAPHVGDQEGADRGACG